MKIIAESASNHDGSIEYLKELAEATISTGADYFTFQVLNANEFAEKTHPKFEFYKKIEIKDNDWIDFFNYCKDFKIKLLPCVLDVYSFDLCYKYGFRLFKIHGTDISNKTLLEYISDKNDCGVILESQYATNFEIGFAISILKDNIECILTGYSSLPTEFDELNLNSIDAMREDYNVGIGFADHTTDTNGIPLMALAKGCIYFEKHITLKRNNRKPDWQVSLDPLLFKIMVDHIRAYEVSLGIRSKHLSVIEKNNRNIYFKKQINNGVFRRSVKHSDYITNQINTFQVDNTIIALIARLKSKRLPLKVFKPFCNDILINDLYRRLVIAQHVSSIFITTSYLPEDNELVKVAQENDFKYYLGHPLSVIDRMLTLLWQEKAGAVFRVTGDNPFTDPFLIDEMVILLKEHNLDYVRVNNVPTGVSAELYSSKYLWELYLKLENPNNSEYLTWYVLNDIEAKKGSIDVKCHKSFLEKVNLSIDYHEDYDRALKLLKSINKNNFTDITLNDIINKLDYTDVIDINKQVKLPNNEYIKYLDYIELKYRNNYLVRKELVIN
jgi:sialic acid synthase SpsE/spore coat polysaccharide biosynthesis protein SpsF (cytidylyltransferase family)